ncbi:TetR/AcrR family transcriptional regulator [Micromonospora sp. WMMD956]|uniref:TetR/AcrR family transcriptional regulator n=1 Tax=Micromonospora sp. WMMD956 TaxID=3016108 RepID=UPI0024169E6F|nr:TetR/AcrR family transcriptional regulator [Micromonospora sp. WMMD956]MDG4814722.1 TetR/AcrR family transcriptional regulator [Micromonospora sp. WMMD956]
MTSSAEPVRPSIWSRPARGTRGPAPTHTRDEIVAAAIAMADTDGLGAVSMRAVATALDTGAGSLYRYLTSRDDLLDLMADRAAGELRPYPEATGDWLDAMLRIARRQLELYRRHRWLVEILPRPTALGPESLAFFDHCLAVLRPVPAATTTKFEAIAMTTGVVSLFARSEAAGPPARLDGIDPAAFPHLAAALAAPQAPPAQRDLFEATVRGVLRGLLGDAGEAEGRPSS